MKKLISIIISALLIFASLSVANADTTEKPFDGYIYMTVEKITLNQGLVQSPVKVGYYKENSLAELMENVLGERSTYKGELKDYYLQGVADGGDPDGWTTEDIPLDIRRALDFSVGERSQEDILGSYDYSFYGGWQFTVDNHTTNLGAGQMFAGEDSSDGNCFANGSVVRLQYSLYGYGEDIGVSWGFCPFETTNTFPDRGSLIKKLAEINSEKNALSYGKAYDSARDLLNCWNVTSTQLDTAVKSLENAENHSDHSYTYTKNSDGTHKAVCVGKEEFVENCSFINDKCSLCDTQRILGIYGDVNLDNEVNIRDVTLIQKYLAEKVNLSNEQIFFAEYDKENLTVVTGTKIQKWINKSFVDGVIGTNVYFYR